MKHQVGTDAIAGRKPSVGGALRARVQRVFSGLRAGLCGWWWLVLLAGFPAAVEATDFFYDVNGRLVAVTNDGGQSARYRYDAMGNLVRIDRLAVGELALFGFAPARGAAGSQVKIRGQGFSANPAGNTVRFDGVLSSVVSSTATELVAVVPGGAGTGPVSVTVGAATAVSADDFIVDAAMVPPAITAVSPLVVGVGQTLTVDGTNLEPIPQATSVFLGGRLAVAEAVAATQIRFPVPADATHGPVTVTTAYGRAVSAERVMVMPAGIAPGEVDEVRWLTVGAPAEHFALAAAGRYVAVLFDAVDSDFLTAQFSALSGGSLQYSLYGVGSALMTSGTLSAGNPTLTLPKLPRAGSYLLLLKSTAASTSWELALARDGWLEPDGATLSAGSSPWKRRFHFFATEGANLGLGLSDLTTSDGKAVTARVYGPSGSQVGSGLTCFPSYGGCEFNLSNLAAGEYMLMVEPSTGSQTMGFEATLSSDLAGTLVRNVPLDVSLARRGQNARLWFYATAGETVGLEMANATLAPSSGGSVNYTVYRPDGVSLKTGSTASGLAWILANLPQSGEYTILVSPTYGATASSRVVLTTRRLEVDGASVLRQTTLPGEQAYLQFTAPAGANLGLGLSGLTTSDGKTVAARVYGPSGSQVGSGVTCFPSYGGCEFNLSDLAAGEYALIVEANNGTQTMSLEATLSSDLAGTLARNVPLDVSLARRGQNARLRFYATAGETVGLELANATVAPSSGGSVNYVVYRPDGVKLKEGSTTFGLAWMLASLPQSGEYTVLVSPVTGATASSRVALTTRRLEVDGASVSRQTTLPGEQAYWQFTALAGAHLGLGLSGLTTSDGQYVLARVYGPSGSQHSVTTCYPSNGGCEFNLSDLAAGEYALAVDVYNGSRTMSFEATLSSDLAGMLVRNVPLDVSLARRGQNARLRFYAAAGETVGLELANATVAPSSGGSVNYVVYRPDGVKLKEGSTTFGLAWMLANLPQSGEYTVLVDPANGATASSRVVLTTRRLEVDGASVAVQTALPGAPAYLQFTASVGVHLGLGLSGLTTSDGQYVLARVYGPSGSQHSVTTCYPSNGGCDFNLSDLAAGEYALAVDAYNGSRTMSFEATLSSDLSGTLVRDVPQSVTLNRYGQNARLSFSGSSGEVLYLRVSAQSTQPSGRTVYYRVYKPDGTLWTTLSASAAQSLKLPALPASGGYAVLVDPIYGATGAVTVTLSDTP